jgi:hypothetical protein
MGTKLVEKGITRYDIDEQGTYGFMMRISRGGEHINEFFSDKNFKGKRKALTAARKRYAALRDSLPPPKTTKGIKTARNQTGVVGVHLAVCESIYGEAYSSYCASWKTADGRRKKISFSFKKYGKKKSWELACLARQLESTDRARVERLHASRTKSKKKIAPPPKVTVLAKKKKAAKKKTKQKVAKKKVTKNKVTKKKVTKKKKASKKKASKKKASKKKATSKKTAKKKVARKKAATKRKPKKKSVKRKKAKRKKAKRKTAKRKTAKRKKR